jgi:hypothetical protein
VGLGPHDVLAGIKAPPPNIRPFTEEEWEKKRLEQKARIAKLEAEVESGTYFEKLASSSLQDPTVQEAPKAKA